MAFAQFYTVFVRSCDPCQSFLLSLFLQVVYFLQFLTYLGKHFNIPKTVIFFYLFKHTAYSNRKRIWAEILKIFLSK